MSSPHTARSLPGPAVEIPVAEWIAVSVLAAAFLLCLVALAWTTGVTVDEPSHFLSGRLYWEGRDNLRPGDMPPLMKIVSGWVPLVMHAPLPPPSSEAWKYRNEWDLALGMVEKMTAAEVQRYFFAARLPMLLFPMGCALLIWYWGRQVFSRWAAVATAAVFCLCPTVLGHSALVKNDLAATFGYLLFWYCAWRYWRAPDWRKAAWLGVAVLCGMLSKYSLAILVPLAPLILVGRHLRRPRRAALHCVACAVVVYVGVWAAWQFRMQPITAIDRYEWKANPSIPRLVPAAIRVASVIPLPGAFWRGGVSLISSNDTSSAYLLGRTLSGGHPLYFLIALAVKLPIALQLLFIMAVAAIAAALLRRRLRPGDWLWIVPGFLYLALASLSGLQLGVRLVLPALAMLIFLTGKAFEWALARRSRTVLCAVLVVWLGSRTVIAYPHYIAYFNQFVGDSWHGLRILSDSNIDWGQDLRALAGWYRTAGIPRLKLSYFGTENVYAYFNDRQIELTTPPWSAEMVSGRTRIDLTPGYYAISATLISGQIFAPEFREYYAAFRDLEPIDRAGDSIFIFRVPND